jgi:hypothetical protein
VINTVLKYNAKGLHCLPIKDDKSPFLNKSWHNGFVNESDYKDAFGIGIICGKKSDNLECIDFDNHFENATLVIKDFISQIKGIYEKYKFPIEKTMNGGYHLLYRCDEIGGNLKLAWKPKWNESLNKWEKDILIETRGQGGYFACDPTPKYKIIKNDILNIPRILPEERNILFSVCKSFNEWIEPVKENEFESQEKPGNIFNADSNSINEVKDVLSKNGWVEIRDKYWRRPGKEDGISATLGKVGTNIFAVFSSSAPPFENGDLCKGYTPFQVIGLLKYNGDFKEFARELAQRYELIKTKPIVKSESKVKTEDELSDILTSCYIDTNVEIDRPPVALYVSDISGMQTIRKRLFTLGNFSAVIGKAKSRKTFLVSMLTAAMLKNDSIYHKFHGSFPENKNRIMYFDTEQGDYDAANNIKRVQKLCGHSDIQLNAFNLRPFSPLERCDLIEHALLKLGNVGLVVIDGIADLAKAINDEEEATRVTTLLLRWSKVYTCHIITVIHQNKNDNFATGHLGSSVMKKAEAVISVFKEKGSNSPSTVSCDYSRGLDFEDFSFEIVEGLPVVIDIKPETKTIVNWND